MSRKVDPYVGLKERKWVMEPRIFNSLIGFKIDVQKGLEDISYPKVW